MIKWQYDYISIVCDSMMIVKYNHTNLISQCNMIM